MLGAKLSGFAGILGSEVNPGRRLGSEISDYAKLAGVGGVIHSDEDLSKYGFSQAEINDIKTALEIGEKDAFLIITGPPGVCDKAMAYALQRAETAIREVPKETRVADSKQKITKFLRPLPGGSRMYPETDAKPIEINKMAYEELLKNKVDVEKIEKELEKEIGNKELAEQMLWSPMLPLYNELVEKTGVEGSAVANVLLQKYPELRRRGANVDEITPEALEAIFEQYKLGKITKAAIEIVLSKEPKDRKEVMQAIREERLERITGKELEKLVEGYIASNKGARKEELIRKILEEHRINIDATELSNLLNKRIR